MFELRMAGGVGGTTLGQEIRGETISLVRWLREGIKHWEGINYDTGTPGRRTKSTTRVTSTELCL